MGKRSNGRYIIADVVNRQMAASNVRKTILMTAQMDRDKYSDVRIRLPQDPGQAGKEQAESYIKFLSGFNVTTELESGSKATRAEPMAARWKGWTKEMWMYWQPHGMKCISTRWRVFHSRSSRTWWTHPQMRF